MSTGDILVLLCIVFVVVSLSINGNVLKFGTAVQLDCNEQGAIVISVSVLHAGIAGLRIGYKMVILEPHFHFATGKTSKNRGGFYRCRKYHKTDVLQGCTDYPAYRDPEGKELIFDTRWDLIEAGFFPEDSDLTLDQMKEALDSPCMIGRPMSQVLHGKRQKRKSIKLVIV
jgi:hypothetical protein